MPSTGVYRSSVNIGWQDIFAPKCMYMKTWPEFGGEGINPFIHPALDDLESHRPIVVNVSSTSNIIPSFFKIGRSRFFGKL